MFFLLIQVVILSAKDIPVTSAVRFLRDKKAEFVPHMYQYKEKGGTKQTSAELNIDEHSVVKTLVMESESGRGMIVLMHGDFEVSTKDLARACDCKSVQPCELQKAMKLTGYQFGGTSPFGTRSPLPVYVEEMITALDKIYINGGKQGFIIEVEPSVLFLLPDVSTVNVAIKK